MFVDTSDGTNLVAQFEITSMNSLARSFDLTLRGCALLERLKVSHRMLLPPNRSVMVNLSVPLPFYAEHKKEKCEGKNSINLRLMSAIIDRKLPSSEHRKLL